MVKVRRSLVSAVLGLALVVAACGGGGSDVTVRDPDVTSGEPDATVDEPDATVDEPDATVDGAELDAAAKLVAASPDRLEAETSARMAMAVEMSGIPDVATDFQGVGFTAEGVFDFATGDATMTMDMSSMGIPGGGAYEIRALDGVVYMNIGAFGDAAGFGALGLGDASWLRFDSTQAAADLGIDPADLGAGTDLSDFTASFDMLRELSSSVTELGREDVRGTETTRYLVELDAQAVLEQAADQMPEGYGYDAAGGLDALGFDTLPVEVWIDDDGLLRRMVMTFSGSDFAGGVPGGDVPDDFGMTVTMEMYDFGADVNVEVPPESDTVDITDLLGGFGGFGDLDEFDDLDEFGDVDGFGELGA